MRASIRAFAAPFLTLTLTLLLAAGPAPDAPVADAAMRGDLEAVRALIKQGAEVNAAQGDGMTALHWAAEQGNAEMASLLVFAGAEPNAVTRLGGHTPLHVAAEAGAGQVVKVLIEAGANVSATTTTGVTPLHFAALSGSMEAVDQLLARGADANAREGSWGQTPLMFAASRNRVGTAKVLVERGADVTITSKVVSFAKLAANERRAGAVRDSVLLAFRGRAVDQVIWRPDPMQVQAALRSARQHEAVFPEEKVVHIDWDSAQTAGRGLGGGDAVGYQGGHTALLHAVREGHRDVALALLDAGADINQRGAGDLTSPLLSAMLNGHFDLGLELLARGADPNIPGAYPASVTPLYAVINTQWNPKARYPQQQAYQQQRATHLDAMEALLKAGANPNARLAADYWFATYNFGSVGIDFWGATPFFRAAHGLDVPAMKLLIRYGADPNVPTKAPPGGGGRRGGGPVAVDPSGLPPVKAGEPGMYPIHAAAGNSGDGASRAGNFHRHVRDGWLPAVKYLVEELGADVTLRDHMGYGTIHGAAGRGMNDIVLYLLEKGADPFLIGRGRGMTTVDLANGPADGTSPYPETIRLLESLGVVNNHRCVFC
jgi:ankyrin repeat protein